MPRLLLLIERDLQHCQCTANVRPHFRVTQPLEREEQIIYAAPQLFERAISHTQHEILRLAESRNHVPKLVLCGHRPGAHFEWAESALTRIGGPCPAVTVSALPPAKQS